MRNKLVALTMLLMVVLALPAQNATTGEEQNAKMEWWRNAKFGMFIHWGIYSVPAGIWGDKTWAGEWIMNQYKISRYEYLTFTKFFYPFKFNADQWVQLAKDAGQKYLVITSKHHDGFAMFKSKVDFYNVCDTTPFKRDVIREISDACHHQGIKLGLYYSQAQDWYHPGGAVPGKGEEWDNSHKGNMDQYINDVALPQVKELLSNYGKVSEFWFDTPINMTKERAARFDTIVRQYPDMIVNNRLGGGYEGDIMTPEQFIPATGYPGKNWEVCMTMNNNWGYNAFDDNWKTTKDIVRKLVDVVSKGGNLLLNVGPNRYGEIPVICQRELREVGNWLKVNGEAIYGTESSPFPFLPFGKATRKGNTLYLHIQDWKSTISIPYAVKVKKAYLLEYKDVPVKYNTKGNYTYFQLPNYSPDDMDAVLAVECDKAIPTQPIPSQGAKMSVNDSVKVQLSDGDYTKPWAGTAKKEVVKISLDKPQTVQCLASVEPWRPWNNISQEYKLEGMVDGKWVELLSGKSDGTGTTIPFKAVTAKDFRLTVTNAKENVRLIEVMLFN